MIIKNALMHSILVGIIAALATIIFDLLEVKIWVVFFGWANYFLQSCDIKKSFKMLFAFFVGIFIALIGSYANSYLNTLGSGNNELFVTVFIVFCTAVILIFLEIIENWDEFIPATFLGAVLFFASGVNYKTILPELLVPFLVGIFAGYITILSRGKLTLFLNKKS